MFNRQLSCERQSTIRHETFPMCYVRSNLEVESIDGWILDVHMSYI